MAILHKNITAGADIHNPKWFSGANNGDYAFKNEKGELESIDELLLPAALNFVDGSVAPPTTNSGDIYILSSGGSVNAGWGSVSLQDWVRYDGTQWNSITPQKSSLCYDKTADLLKVYDGSSWAGMGSSFGKYAISDSSGAFTYYSTIQDALTAASSGDVIEQFANVTVTGTTTINLIDGVTWNMNGYTYKNNDAGQCAMFTIPTNTTVKFTFKNGTIIRDGGTYSGSNNGVVQSGNYYDSEVICDNTIFTAATGFPFYGNAKVVGGTFKGQYFYAQGSCVNIYVSTTNGSAVAGSNARIYNSYFYASNNYHYPTNGCLSYNSTFESDGSYGAYLGNGNSEAHNCTFISSTNYGLRMLGDNATQYSRAFNCVGISSSGYGIYMTGHAKAYNCSAFAKAGHGAGVFGYSEFNNCSVESKAGIGVLSGNDTIIKNCSIVSKYNNSSGHALEFFGGYSANGFIAVGNYLKVTNSSAFCLKVAAANDGKWAGNTYEGASTAESITNANLMSNTPDSYNNILL